MEINGFDTLGELQKQFPIGTAVEWKEPYSYTAFFYKGIVEEFDETSTIFTNPRNKKTEEYINGKFS